MKNSLLFLALAAFLLTAHTEPLRGEESLTKEAIRQAWLARETQAERMKLSWDEEVMHPKGSVSSAIPDLQAGPPLPSADTTHTHRRDMLVDDKRIRISGKTTLWNVDTAKFETVFQEELRINLEPLWLATRPGNWNYLPRYRLDYATLNKELVTVDGMSYVELKWDSPSLGTKRRLLLDPKTFIVRRAEEGLKKIIIDYHTEGPQSGWPSSWAITSDEAYARKHRSTVRSLEFPKTIPIGDFEVKGESKSTGK